MEELGFPGARAAAPLPGECSGGRGPPHTRRLAPPPCGCLARSPCECRGSVSRLRCMPARPALRFPSRALRVLPVPANAAPPSRWLWRWRRRRRRRRLVSLAPVPSVRAKPLAPPPPIFLGRVGRGRGGPRRDCKCVCPGTGSGCGGAGDEEEWGGLGGGCLSSGWQSSAPWRGEGGTSQRRVFEEGVGLDIGRKDPVRCPRGAKVLGGQLGVSSR